MLYFFFHLHPAITVDTDVNNGLISQDGQFLQVDAICDDGDIYLTAPNGQPLTYMGE